MQISSPHHLEFKSKVVTQSCKVVLHFSLSLGKTCIGFASTLLIALHLVIISSFITLHLYTSQH